MDNPYQAPDSLNVAPNPSPQMGGGVTQEVIRALQGTKGWVRFLAVLGFIFSALMVIGGIGIMMTASRGVFGGLAIGMGLAYIFFAFLNVFAAFKLNRYASRISDLLLMPSELKLVAALDAQRGFWKYVGIMAICVLALYLLGIIFGVASALINR